MKRQNNNLSRRLACFLLSSVVLLGGSGGVSPKVFAQNSVDEISQETEMGVTALKSNITDMNLDGYVGENVKGNVKNWQIDAYSNNKNIVEQIAMASAGDFGLDTVLGQDYFGVDDYWEIDVKKTADVISETYIGSALMYSPKKADAYRGDAGFRLDHGTYPGITDWTSTKEAWIFVDASSYGADVYLRFNFEEGEPGVDGWEAYTPSQGKESRLISAVDGEEQIVKYVWYDNLGDAFFKIEKGFKGFLAIPFNNDYFWCYASGGTVNGKIDGKNVRQMTIAVGGATQEAVGTPLYFSFAKIGNFENGLAVPFGKGLQDTDKFTNVLPVTPYTYVLDISMWAGAYVGDLYNDWDVYFTTNYRGRKGDSLGWTLKKVPSSFSDRDFRFVNDPNAITNWSGAEELWVYVDASEVSSSVKVRIAFEENAVGRESYALIDGATVYLLKNGEDTYRTRKVSVESGGYVPLPEKFAGYIRLPLNTSTFVRYWNEGGNDKLDLTKVVQFQLSVKADDKAQGKTVYMDDFSIVGNVDGEKLDNNMYLGSNVADKDNPETAWKYVDTSYTKKTIWQIDGLAQRKGYSGSMVIWYGEFVGKLLTGMAYSYKATNDQELKASADEIIADLAEAQGEDGYLGVFLGGARYSLSENNWDLWNQYHCISGLLEWYKLTGNSVALDVAKKAADCILETFKDRSYIVAGGFETNRGIAHGYALLYQITKEGKYLNEAYRIIEEDCKNNPNGWYECALNGKDFYTSNCTRWEVLHMVMTLGILYEETGHEEYYNVMGAVWESVLKTDIHNSGGFTTNEGACGNPYAEGVIETCCTIAWSALTNEYLKYNKTVRVADELERSYFNGLLGSLLDDDKYCTYNTPMDGIQGSCGGYDGRRVPSQKDIAFQYNSGSPDMNCCQANIARGIGQIAEWAVMGDDQNLYLNYYGPSSIQTLIGSTPVTITQETAYPIDGKVKITINDMPQDTEFTLKLRIPTWAYGSKITLDGKTVIAQSGEYYSIEKTWKNGDEILLDIAVSFTYWTGEREQSGFASVYYGPILLALDKSIVPTYNQNVPFTVSAIENANVKAGRLVGTMLVVDVEIEGEIIKLVDFASAGKYNGTNTPATYWSWLKVVDAPSVKEGVTWLNTDKHKVYLGENLSANEMLVYQGQSVELEVNVPEGYQVDKFTLSEEGVEVVFEEGIYSFIMPNSDVSINVSFKEDNQPNTSETPSASDGQGSSSSEAGQTTVSCGGSLGGQSAISVVLVAGIAYSLLKTKKRKQQ